MPTLSRADNSVLGRWWWTVDRWTLGAIGVLIGFGYIMMLAATPAVAERIGSTRDSFIIKQVFFLALAGVLARGSFPDQRRIGLFSYGSGCSSEFYSGLADERGARMIRDLDIDGALAQRRELSIPEYETLLVAERQSLFGQREAWVEPGAFEPILASHFAGTGRLILDGIINYQRRYRWV